MQICIAFKSRTHTVNMEEGSSFHALVAFDEHTMAKLELQNHAYQHKSIHLKYG